MGRNEGGGGGQRTQHKPVVPAKAGIQEIPEPASPIPLVMGFNNRWRKGK